MRFLAAAAAYIASLWVTFMVVVFGVLSFAGPHSKPPSATMELVIYALAGLAVLVVPAWAARAAYRALDKRSEG